jgi:DNA-binding LytR/AlgR family response regulator
MSMLWAAVWQTLVIAVLLVGVFMTFDNARLRREIERVQQINDRLSQKNIAATPAQTAASAPTVPASTVPAPAVETQNFASLQPNSVQTSQSEPIQSTKNNDTTINPDTLLYIESDKNYCKITTADGTSVLRSTLITLENQLKPCGHIIRCHRAFLVNLLSVEGILGSASNGYKLKIKGHDLTVPVSRTYIGDILGYFER